jgi:hypothetical protein
MTAGDSNRAGDRVSLKRSAAVVVEGAAPVTLSRDPTTMIIIGILLNIVGLGVFCWAVFTLAVQALPFFVGLTAGISIYQTGTGPFAAIVVGFMTGGFTLVLGRYTVSVKRAPIVRLLIGLVFALPAARAGYDVTLALAHIGTSSEWWRKSFALLGAITVGSTAWARLSMQTESAPGGMPPWAQPRHRLGAGAKDR